MLVISRYCKGIQTRKSGTMSVCIDVKIDMFAIGFCAALAFDRERFRLHHLRYLDMVKALIIQNLGKSSMWRISGNRKFPLDWPSGLYLIACVFRRETICKEYQ